MMEKYLDLTNELLKSFDEYKLQELDFKTSEYSIKFVKDTCLKSKDNLEIEKLNEINKVNDVIEDNNKKHKAEIFKAPIVGVFYSSKDPNSPPFVKVGDKVKKNQTICILEAMKMMHEIKAPFDARVINCLVENEEFVEFGRDLFLLERL